MAMDEFEPVRELETWFGTTEEILFYLTDSSQRRDGSVKLELSLTAKEGAFTINCPSPNGDDAFGIKADTESERTMADEVSGYARENKGIIGLGDVLDRIQNFLHNGSGGTKDSGGLGGWVNEGPVDNFAHAALQDVLVQLAVVSGLPPRVPDDGTIKELQEFRKEETGGSKEDGAQNKRKRYVDPYTRMMMTIGHTEQEGGWKKGTGYGGYLNRDSWDPESLQRKKAAKEGQIIHILQNLLGQIIQIPDEENEEILAIISGSVLLPFLEAELKESSWFESPEAASKFDLIVEILAAVGDRPFLLKLLGPDKEHKGKPIIELLAELAQTSQDYIDRVGKPQKRAKLEEDAAKEISISQKIVDIAQQLQIQLVSIGVEGKMEEEEEDKTEDGSEEEAKDEEAEAYKKALKPLQWGPYTAITQAGAAWAHKFAAGKNGKVTAGSPAMRRIGKEMVSLKKDLPLELGSAVAVRVDDGRIDLIRACILGPEGTPYAHGAFIFDIGFPGNYPAAPPMVQIVTTGGGTVRFNPNLYNNGMVCLSLLGTWQGHGGENWNSSSSLLQVLVSIQSLILVEEPYFNEPGHQSMMGSPNAQQQSKAYSTRIRRATLQWAIHDALLHPAPEFAELIKAHFKLKKDRLMKDIKEWAQEDNGLKGLVDKIKKELEKL